MTFSTDLSVSFHWCLRVPLSLRPSLPYSSAPVSACPLYVACPSITFPCFPLYLPVSFYTLSIFCKLPCPQPESLAFAPRWGWKGGAAPPLPGVQGGGAPLQLRSAEGTPRQLVEKKKTRLCIHFVLGMRDIRKR